MIASRRRWPPRTWTGYAAAAWALAFAGLSFYWAAGGRLGLGTLALTLRDKTLAREQGFVALLWFTGALKLLVALLAFALVRRWGTVLARRVLLVAGWAAGAALALYGALGLINGGLAQVGAVQAADANAARWYFVLWGPIWLVGGLLILATVRQQMRLGHGNDIADDIGGPVCETVSRHGPLPREPPSPRSEVTDRKGPARWAVWLAGATVASVVPSAIWRTAVGLGVDLGWSQQHLDFERIPGLGTFYVIALSLLSLFAASFTLGLVRPWGERFPGWLPIVGGRPVPVSKAVVAAVIGASFVITICVMSIVRWDEVSGFADRPDSGWARVMAACYLPAVFWGPMLLAVTWDYWTRLRANGGTRLTSPVGYCEMEALSAPRQMTASSVARRVHPSGRRQGGRRWMGRVRFDG